MLGNRTLPLHPNDGWQLSICRDSCGRPCPVLVGGRQVDSVWHLADGDLLKLGGPSCIWRFCLPVADSATALLEAVPGTRALAWTAI